MLIHGSEMRSDVTVDQPGAAPWEATEPHRWTALRTGANIALRRQRSLDMGCSDPAFDVPMPTVGGVVSRRSRTAARDGGLLGLPRAAGDVLGPIEHRLVVAL